MTRHRGLIKTGKYLVISYEVNQPPIIEELFFGDIPHYYDGDDYDLITGKSQDFYFVRHEDHRNMVQRLRNMGYRAS